MQRVPFLYYAHSDINGRGVFTAQDLMPGDMIEISPVIVLPSKELAAINGTKLHDYYFLWGDEQNQPAIALGYGSLFNHSYRANANYVLDFENETIEFFCVKEIPAGSEILVNYNGEPDEDTPVWFDDPESGRYLVR